MLDRKRNSSARAQVPQQRRRPRQTLNIRAGKQDFRASLKILGWLNDTLDAAAECVGRWASRDAALGLLIIHREAKAKNGKKLLQLYETWSGAGNSRAAESSLQLALGQLLRAGLVTVGEIGGVEISTLRGKGKGLQVAIGKLLEKGLRSLRKVRLTKQGQRRIGLVRRKIGRRLEGLRKDLTPPEREVFDRLIKKSLPYPASSPGGFM